MKPELISFNLCPFVQRSVIVLQEKDIPYDITYINLNSPPDWFEEISPLGKVPLLKMGDTVLFESAVIMEYLDETSPPSLHPSDPLHKAHNRAWIEFSSELIGCQYRMFMMAGNKQEYDAELKKLIDNLGHVETQIRGPLFNGESFSLVDAAFAPFFMRMQLLHEWCTFDVLSGLPKTTEWAHQLLQRDSVKNSVIKAFPDLYMAYIEQGGGYATSLFID